MIPNAKTLNKTKSNQSQQCIRVIRHQDQMAISQEYDLLI